MRYGVLSPQELVLEAAQHPEIRTLALTDINNSSAAAEFTRRCLEHGIRPILGIEFHHGQQFLGIGLACGERGWEELCQILSEGPSSVDQLRQLARNSVDLYLMIDRLARAPLAEHEYIALQPHELGTLGNLELRKKAIAWWPIAFTDASQRRTHELLRAIELKQFYRFEPMPTSGELCFHRPEILNHMFRSAPELVTRAHQIMENCDQALHLGQIRDKESFTDARQSDAKLLTELSKQGLREKYGAQYRKHVSLLEHELAVICNLGMAAYFLICWDLVRFARQSGIRHVGRGSGANSLCAYCLNITNVDPVRLQLHFDRFLNKERCKPPDFDLDFAWSRRDEVLDYLWATYSEDKVALLATYSTFKGRAVVWEVGRAFGFSRDEIKVIVDEPNNRGKHHPLTDVLFQYGKKIIGLPNYLSVHSGGLIIGEGNLSKTTALWTAPKGYRTTYFDMHHAELLGYHKYDLLSQRALGYLGDLEAQLPPSTWQQLDHIENLEDDDKTMKLLRTGKTIGSFYIESPAMQSLLRKVPCNNYEDLIEVSSIIRPGVAKSGMMQTYIRRALGLEPVRYLHPDLRECVSGQGVMIFQEDVMKVGQRIGGFDAAQADSLRRFMTGKTKNKAILKKLRSQFLTGAQRKGYEKPVIDEIWRQVASFQGYSFCKAHSATYAVESMQSLYLKAHYPGLFMESVINNGGGFYDLEVYLLEARRLGLIIERPCLRYGSYLATCIGNRLYLGFKHIKQLGPSLGATLLSRISRLSELSTLALSAKQRWLLYRAGALRNLVARAGERERLYHALERTHLKGQLPLFTNSSSIPHFKLEAIEDVDRALEEIDLYGFTFTNPFKLLQIGADRCNDSWRTSLTQQVEVNGYLLHKKPVTTAAGKHMNFAFWLGQDDEYFETVHWEDSLKRSPFGGRGIYRLQGKVQYDYGQPTLIVDRMHGRPLREQLISMIEKTSLPKL